MAQTHAGKVAIVTGAGRGIGRSMAMGLLEAGAQVAAADIDGNVLEELASGAHNHGAAERLLTWQGDVASDEGTQALVRACLTRFGHLDILVNNAGINLETVRAPDEPIAATFRELPPAQFRRIMEINTVSPFLMARAAVEPMIERKWGRIIGITTSLDAMWRKGMIPYGSSKAAHEAMVAAMAEELAGTGVSANVLVPGGPVNTRMTASFGARQSALIRADVMVAPLLWLTSATADGVTGRRFIAALWDKSAPPAEAAAKCGAPAAWPQLGNQTIFPPGSLP
jgi:NAD(P)-dependent dehydrogenase (short-subunit alcohol dehydrogenase family)